MKTMIGTGKLWTAIAAIFYALAPVETFSQQRDSIVAETLAVAARPSSDSITLRWAPLSFKTWHLANINGYRIERYIVTRNGALLSKPEIKILSEEIKPLPVEQWEPLVRANTYGAIAAQALYGDRFEVDLSNSDVITVVNKVQENEQRFAFTLFCADMSKDVAAFSGLWFTDTLIKKGEKYLYRVSVNGADSLRGSVFISPDDDYRLTAPQNLKAEFHDRAVSLKWDHSLATAYTAYEIERSEDGVLFTKISDTPLVTVSPDKDSEVRYEYATDSLPNGNQTFHYRITGITPFGEQGPPSAVVSGRSIPRVMTVPYIVSAESANNATILLTWDFPQHDNVALAGFSVERASGPDRDFNPITPALLPASARSFEDIKPEQANYYRVRAKGLDSSWYPSHVYFAQLVDSIPPGAPSGLEAKITDDGNVLLTWEANAEKDIYGYRIYRSNQRSEEPAQVTIAPLQEPVFKDSINVNTLNEHIYYSVMAVDINQNHSALSNVLQIALPDRVKPQSPVFLPPASLPEGVLLSWLPAASEDITEYHVYRKTVHENWQRISSIKATTDSLFSYFDRSAEPGQASHYTVISVDDAGLRSEPAKPMTGVATRHNVRPPITWRKPDLLRESNQVRLSWKYEVEGIESFRIFRSADSQTVVLKTLPALEREYTDTMIPGKNYQYRIMALFADGNKSAVSEELQVQY